MIESRRGVVAPVLLLPTAVLVLGVGNVVIVAHVLDPVAAQLLP